ncbi:hypothetical protein E2C01_052861 [Portunus trituberculatus]|uniref:Uncharacterized protein n=1 Tax=Portunus trituberculatus TaxID=210409 RepID=A0A5B7GFN9_PORTR|nr:hypothetical protein [Portunus trituberculatus]
MLSTQELSIVIHIWQQMIKQLDRLVLAGGSASPQTQAFCQSCLDNSREKCALDLSHSVQVPSLLITSVIRKLSTRHIL